MSGHSKWNNIKNRKGAVDAKKGKVFGLLSKQIRIAVKEGKSGDPGSNPSLRTLLDKARAANMPKSKVDAAIDRGLGKSASGAVIQEILYEAFGPAGEGILILAHTENPNRTSSDIKFALSRSGGSIGGPGSAQYLFDRRGADFVPKMQLAASAGQALQLEQIIDALREIDDVEDVFVSVDLPDNSDSDE